MDHFDYIILGAGAAGLSLLVRMIDSGQFSNKKILLVDKERKTANDRTWCFWEKGEGYFESLVCKSWEKLEFKSNALSRELDIAPYRYKMIRGIDFYNFCLGKIVQQPNIEIRYAAVTSDRDNAGRIHFGTGADDIDTKGAVIFNSIYFPQALARKELQVLQHFKGWVIQTERKCFDPAKAILMDFRVHQQFGTSFVYLLPLSPDRALVEYTQFNQQVLPNERYDEELKNYLERFYDIGDYKIEEEEFGIIPMTNRYFPFFSQGMYHIGAAGGQTKASTGYTFQFVQKQASRITECLVSGQPLLSLSQRRNRFHFYDSVLLRLLVDNKLGGREIFSRLFERNRAATVFKFLGNESSFPEELGIISSLQIFPFLRAAGKVIF